jgi:hypothetical protein
MNVEGVGTGYKNFVYSSQSLSNKETFNQDISYDKPIKLKMDGLFSIGRPTGESATVYKSKDFSETNPVYLVKGTDKNGAYFEQEINVNEVNPNNCSFVELIALGVHLGKNHEHALANALDMTKKENNDYFTKQDFMPHLYYMRDCQKSANNLIGYTRYDQFIKSLLEHCERNNFFK